MYTSPLRAIRRQPRNVHPTPVQVQTVHSVQIVQIVSLPTIHLGLNKAHEAAQSSARHLHLGRPGLKRNRVSHPVQLPAGPANVAHGLLGLGQERLDLGPLRLDLGKEPGVLGLDRL